MDSRISQSLRFFEMTPLFLQLGPSWFALKDKVLNTKAPAKLNLRLKVTGRRPDGYHELVSLMVPIDICDVLKFRQIPEKIELLWEGLPVPVDGHNLVQRAAAAFFDRSRVRGGISVKVTKNIPVAAGMGGGSSDAAATLLSLNQLWSEPLSPEAAERRGPATWG